VTSIFDRRGALEYRTYCRICPGACGLIASIQANRVRSIRPDPDHAGSRGYICLKALAYPEMHHGPARLRAPLHRAAAGAAHESMRSEAALDQVAERVAGLLERHGPRAIAMFYGTAITGNQLQLAFALSFFKALGSPSIYSTMTIDQSAKWVTEARMGSWAAGRQAFEGADVWLLCGSNPFVSLVGSMIGWPTFAPPVRLREARERGLRLIVVDPVRTQTAAHADLHLQPVPGEDAVLFASLVRLILERGWHDQDFCHRHVQGLVELRAALGAFDLKTASRRCGVPSSQIEQAARMFAHEAGRGMAAGGTGPDMSPNSNLTEHLIETLNVICGRYPRAGERVPNPGVLHPQRVRRAEVIAPNRSFEGEPRSRVGDHGPLRGQLMSGVLAEEILSAGSGQIRALFCVGSNPAGALPNQRRAVEALRSLELLVTSDWCLSATARLAHYVFAPTLALERPDHTYFLESYAFDSEPFAQYTPALLERDVADDLIDDWYLYWALAKRLGLKLRFAGTMLDMTRRPDTDELLQIMARSAQVPLAEVARHPSGAQFAGRTQHVEPARPDIGTRFQLAPPDVLREIENLATRAHQAPDATDARYAFRLVCRRERETMNTVGAQLETVRRRIPINPAHIHPSDAERLQLSDGDPIAIISEAGRIESVVQRDADVRPGVISMNHGWGALPDEVEDKWNVGAAACRLVSTDRCIEAVNAMPRMSAIPVEILPLRSSSESRTTADQQG